MNESIVAPIPVFHKGKNNNNLIFSYVKLPTSVALSHFPLCWTKHLFSIRQVTPKADCLGIVG
jgi:hypothetical protein